MMMKGLAARDDRRVAAERPDEDPLAGRVVVEADAVDVHPGRSEPWLEGLAELGLGDVVGAAAPERGDVTGPAQSSIAARSTGGARASACAE
eukprot:4035656-Pyramimonas_sp.AAC.1